MHGQQNIKFYDYVLFCVRCIVACVKTSTGYYLALNVVAVRSYAVADRTPILSLSSWCKNVRVMWLWCNMQVLSYVDSLHSNLYRGTGESLARPGRKQATATEDFDVHVSYLLS